MADPGVVHHHVGDAVRGADAVGERLHGLGVGDVEHVVVGHAATDGDQRGGLGDAGLVEVADHDFGAPFGERQRGRPADATARAGHRDQRVSEGAACPADLSAQQGTGGCAAAQVVDELRDRVGHRPGMRQLDPVAGRDVTAPQLGRPGRGLVVHVGTDERVAGGDDELDGHVDAMIRPSVGQGTEVVGAIDLQGVDGVVDEVVGVVHLVVRHAVLTQDAAQ